MFKLLHRELNYGNVVRSMFPDLFTKAESIIFHRVLVTTQEIRIQILQRYVHIVF